MYADYHTCTDGWAVWGKWLNVVDKHDELQYQIWFPILVRKIPKRGTGRTTLWYSSYHGVVLSVSAVISGWGRCGRSCLGIKKRLAWMDASL